MKDDKTESTQQLTIIVIINAPAIGEVGIDIDVGDVVAILLHLKSKLFQPNIFWTYRSKMLYLLS